MPTSALDVLRHREDWDWQVAGISWVKYVLLAHYLQRTEYGHIRERSVKAAD